MQQIATAQVSAQSTSREWRRGSPRVAVIGLSAWESICLPDDLSNPDNHSSYRQNLESPGGSSVNIAVTLSRLGARASIVSAVGSDLHGRRIVQHLADENIGTDSICAKEYEPTIVKAHVASVVLSNEPHSSTVGATLKLGDRVDIEQLFRHDLVLIDVADQALRRFLVDLPIHTVPTTRIMTTLSHIVNHAQEAPIETIFRSDGIVGTARKLCEVTGNDTPEIAIESIRNRMCGSNLRFGAVVHDDGSATVFGRQAAFRIAPWSVQIVDATGAVDAFAGAFAYGCALRWDLFAAGKFALAVASLSSTAVGSQSALPAFDEVVRLLDCEVGLGGGANNPAHAQFRP
jgi:ribokinase